MQWWQYQPEADRLSELLTGLRHQRMLLGALAEDVAVAARRFRPVAPPAEWRSDAQRAYQERREELAAMLVGAERSIEETLSVLLTRIEAVKAQLASEAADAAADAAAATGPAAGAGVGAGVAAGTWATPDGWSE